MEKSTLPRASTDTVQVMSEEIAQLIAQCGGTASRRDLTGTISRRTLVRAVGDGTIRRPRRGVYTLPGLDEALDAGQRVGGVASHRSAALLHGWGVLHAPKKPELVVPRHLRVDAARRRGLDLRYRPLAADDHDGLTTTPLRTVVDCARDLALPEALAVADSALRSGAVSRDELADAVLPRTGRGPARRVLGLASPDAANPFESGLRALAIEAVDELWVPQQEVVVRDGIVLHADVGTVAARVLLEADSHEFHRSRQDVRTDSWRHDEMTIAGWVVLRFAWEHVMFDPGWVREVIAWVVGTRLGRAPAPPGAALP